MTGRATKYQFRHRRYSLVVGANGRGTHIPVISPRVRRESTCARASL
jgi:hypothetical protein